jgi:hypothetical protein
MTSIRRFAAALLAPLILAGCVQDTPQTRFASSTPFSPEWCQAAKGLPNSGVALLSVARCHDREIAGFPKNEEVSAFYYTQAARWGNVDAGAELARLRRPVPNADLLAASQERADRERQNRQIASAIASVGQPAAPARPLSALEQQQLNHERLMGRAPPAQPSYRPVQPPSFPLPMTIPQTSFQQQSRKESTSERRNCTNGVCRTERTTCVNGACTTSIQN